MPASNKNSKSGNTVMDVSKPGKTVPSTSAKPVIVGHRPMVQDPMVTSDTNPESNNREASSEQPLSTPSVAKKVIAPLKPSSTEVSAKNVTAPSDETSAVSTPEESQPGKSETPEAEPVSDASDESAVVDAVVDQMADKKVDEPNEEDRKKQEKIDKLIAEKKYFVPLGKAHHGSGRAFMTVIFLVALVLFGFIAAADAQLIDIGLELPFDLL